MVRGEWGIGLGDPMVAPRRVIALPTDEEQRQRLLEISRSRTEPTSRVERARIILAYLEEPSAYAVAQTMGVTQQTVTRCLKRAAELGVIEGWMIGRVPDATRSLRPRRKPGWWRWHARSPKSWVIPTSCGPLGCSPRMPVDTHRRRGIPASGTWPKERSAKSWPGNTSGRTKYVITSRSAIPTSSSRWPKSSVSTGR